MHVVFADARKSISSWLSRKQHSWPAGVPKQVRREPAIATALHYMTVANKQQLTGPAELLHWRICCKRKSGGNEGGGVLLAGTLDAGLLSLRRVHSITHVSVPSLSLKPGWLTGYDQYGGTTHLLVGSSVLALRRMLYCPGVSSCFHSSSVCTTSCGGCSRNSTKQHEKRVWSGLV
jgi:hypothetical protein